ncbi:hypothetical protein [Cryobacterium sp. SO1]|uniref:hypothetical protein n=1 Tax=Cryobacterium sp. SO1 TaxID=1897061 RepID=UPI001023E254|nr:hypothetical protein [Cryobacterium sp. SO1]
MGTPTDSSSARDRKTRKILADAEKRDDAADVRDVESDERAEAADLQAFLDVNEKYSGHGERRAAALDRTSAKSDREASADDRAELAHRDDADAAVTEDDAAK